MNSISERSPASRGSEGPGLSRSSPPGDASTPPPRARSRVGGWPIAIVGMVLVLVAYELRYTLVPFVFAAVIAFMLEPVLHWAAARTGGRRWPAATVLSLLLFAMVLGGGYWVGQQSVRELESALQKLPAMLHAGLEFIAGPNGLTFMGTHYTLQELTALLIDGITNVINAAQIMLAVQIGMGLVAGLILTLVLVPYFLVSGPRIAEGLIWLVPPERRASIQAMLPVLVPVLRRYAVGLTCVVIYTAAFAYIALGPIFHVPGAPLLGLIVGLLELIPVIGPITSIVLIGLAATGLGTFAATSLVIWALVLRLSIDNLVGPVALGKSAQVHPVVVIFGFIVGAMLFGIIGLLLAVPTAATIRLVLQHYYAEPIAPSDEAEPETVRVRGAVPGLRRRNRR